MSYDDFLSDSDQKTDLKKNSIFSFNSVFKHRFRFQNESGSSKEANLVLSKIDEFRWISDRNRNTIKQGCYI